MKIAYLIRTHAFPRQLNRLVEALRQPGARFYIHIDKKVAEDPFRDVLDPDNNPDVTFIRHRTEMNWGGFSQTRATLRMLKQILAETADDPADYYFLLSGQDYPVMSNSQIVDYLRQHQGTEFMSYHKMPAPFWSEREIRRFTEYQFYDIKWLVWPAYKTGRIGVRKTYRLYAVTQLARKLLPKRQIPYGLVPYGGSAWWGLTHEFISWFMTYLEEHPKLERYFQWTAHPEELFFNTIIMNSPFADRVHGEWTDPILSDYLRYQVWGPLSRPRELQSSDWEDILAAKTMFARKFDEKVDTKILDMIDDRRARIDAAALAMQQDCSGEA